MIAGAFAELIPALLGISALENPVLAAGSVDAACVIMLMVAVADASNAIINSTQWKIVCAVDSR